VLNASDCDDSDADAGLFCGVALSAGTFDMGCTPGQSNCATNESPVHSVTLTRALLMSTTEVSQGQWLALNDNNPSAGTGCGLSCPVETVNWYEALTFANAVSVAEGLPECYTLSGCSSTPVNGLWCATATATSATGSVYDCGGYRLPTEAEWEYAARAGTDLLYAGSNTVSDVAWHDGNSNSTTHPVATRLPNAWGLYDMSGNVWEWTWDIYESGYYNSSPSADPSGPSDGTYRVRRGGGWYDGYANYAHVAHRATLAQTSRSSSLGFRLARTLP